MVKKQFIVDRGGRSFVLYAGLLDEAHAQGLSSVETELIQVPGPMNGEVAICRAKVVTSKGTFYGLGDAAPDNVPPEFVTCLIRMAETRAKARALRDAVNMGMAALEELPDTGPAERAVFEADGEVVSSPSEPAPQIPKAAGVCGECGKALTLSQTQLSVAAFREALCPRCQQARKKGLAGPAKSRV
ncbi:MAG: hypothetical protein AMXMBFR61_00190 [Fimbriimonadales bacterium]